MRLFSLFSISIIFGLTLGYVVGRSSDERLSRIGLETPKLILLTSNPEIFSDNVLESYRQDTGYEIIPIKVKNVDDLFLKQSQASLFLVPSDWVESKSWSAKDIQGQALVERSISPDFLTLTHRETHTIPYLWSKKPDGKNILVEVLSIYYPEKISDSIFNDSLSGFLDPEFVQKILESTKYSTTLMSLDNSQLPRDKKALSLRDLELSKIRIN